MKKELDRKFNVMRSVLKRLLKSLENTFQQSKSFCWPKNGLYEVWPLLAPPLPNSIFSFINSLNVGAISSESLTSKETPNMVVPTKVEDLYHKVAHRVLLL